MKKENMHTETETTDREAGGEMRNNKNTSKDFYDINS